MSAACTTSSTSRQTHQMAPALAVKAVHPRFTADDVTGAQWQAVEREVAEAGITLQLASWWVLKREKEGCSTRAGQRAIQQVLSFGVLPSCRPTVELVCVFCHTFQQYHQWPTTAFKTVCYFFSAAELVPLRFSAFVSCWHNPLWVSPLPQSQLLLSPLLFFF